MKQLIAFFTLTVSLQCAESTGLFDAIRQGNHALAARLIDQGADKNAARGDGLTPLLQAVITSDLKMVKLLIAKGAEVKAKNESGITALHAAAFDSRIVGALIQAGADPNAATSDGQTPVFGALVRGGATPVVKLLLDGGANLNLTRGTTKVPPLRAAIATGDLEAMKMILSHGADVKLIPPLSRFALQGGCAECLRLLLEKGLNPTFQNLADGAATGSLEVVKLLVKHGAPVNGQDSRGYTPLMRAVLTYAPNQELVTYLLAKGADAAPKNETGDTALSMARRFGQTPIVALLKEAGAPDAATDVTLPPPVPDNTVQAAVRRGIPLLEKAAPSIFKQKGCVSCHHNTMPAMVVSMARQRGFAVDEEAAKKEMRPMMADSRARRQGETLGTGIPEIGGYLLLALDAAGYPADARTDLAVHQIAFRQEPDGHWRVDDYRPPQEYSDISGTALAVRALDRYAPPGRAAEMKGRIARARAWLITARPRGAEEHAMRLLGLGWSKASARVISEASQHLAAEQRLDGGWSQLPGMDPDSYATGLALYALHEGGGMPAKDAGYQRGVRHLLDTQRPDGSWFVQTRSYPFQPYFESGFPYGHSQWISAAGSSWALMSLLFTVPEVRVTAALRDRP